MPSIKGKNQNAIDTFLLEEYNKTPFHQLRTNHLDIQIVISIRKCNVRSTYQDGGRDVSGQCLNRRIDDIEVVSREVLAWQEFRNNKNAKVNWQFTTEDARIKLSRLYPTLEG